MELSAIDKIQDQIKALTLECEKVKKGEVGGLTLACLEKDPVRSLELCALEHGEQDSVTVGIDSGAEVSVWPRDLRPEVPMEETSQSRAGVMYYGPGDTVSPSIRNLGRRIYTGQVEGNRRTLRMNICDARRPLVAVCDMNDAGHDVHMMANGTHWAERAETGEVTRFHRRGGRCEFDLKLKPQWSGNNRPAWL